MMVAEKQKRMAPSFRLMGAHDADMFQQLRLRAVHEHQEAFLETPEEVAATSSLRYFENGWIAGAYHHAELIGIAGLYRHKGMLQRHKGTVWGVYVVPEARGLGITHRLITLLLEEAKKAELELIHISAASSNAHALSVYRALGFEEWALDMHMTKLEDGSYIDDVLMRRFLK